MTTKKFHNIPDEFAKTGMFKKQNSPRATGERKFFPCFILNVAKSGSNKKKRVHEERSLLGRREPKVMCKYS